MSLVGRKTPATILKLAATLGALAFGFGQASETFAQASTNNSECYGSQLELLMDAGQDLGEASISLQLSNPDFWLVNVGNGKNLRDVLCRSEPVLARSFVSAVTHGLMPEDVRKVMEAEGVLLTILTLSAISEDGIRLYERSKDWWWENVYSAATTTPDGHLRKPSVDADAVGGSWLLNEMYLDEVGDRISVGCALDCSVRYRLHPKLSLRYHLAISNKEETPDWVVLDRAIRGAVIDWIERE